MSASKTRQRSGIAAVEFAIVVPIFFLLVIGMIEVGRAMMVQQILTNASREGARRAVLEQTTTSEATAYVMNYLEGCAIQTADATVAIEDSTGASITNLAAMTYGEPITVEVSIPHSSVSWLPTSFFMGSSVMSASSTMQTERPE